MITGLLHLHSLLRYLIIIIALWAVIKLIMSKSAGRPFGKGERTPSMLYMILMDVQLLIGLGLYFMSPTGGFNYFRNLSVSEIMGDKVMRFFAIEHILLMLIALVLVHIGYSATKKNIPDSKKYSKAITFFILALVCILVAVPWPFRELGRGWMPGMN